jgi:hypothetical protein
MPGRASGGEVRDIAFDGLTLLEYTERTFEAHRCDVGATAQEVGAETIGGRPRDCLPNRRPAQVEFVGRRRFVHHRAGLRARVGDPLPRRVVREVAGPRLTAGHGRLAAHRATCAFAVLRTDMSSVRR